MCENIFSIIHFVVDQVIFNMGGGGWWIKKSVHLWHEGPVVGVHWQLMICGECIFATDSSMVKSTSNSDLQFCHHMRSDLKKNSKCIGMSESSGLTWAMGIQC